MSPEPDLVDIVRDYVDIVVAETYPLIVEEMQNQLMYGSDRSKWPKPQPPPPPPLAKFER